MIEYSAIVKKGNRESNDDRALIDKQILDETSISGSNQLPFIAVVCDGCGGYQGGGLAAQIVLDTLQSKTESIEDVDSLKQVLKQCEQKVNQKQTLNPDLSSMCTTIAGCLFTDDNIVIFHAGDSRVYRYDGLYLARMTKDHSLVQNLIDMGQITEDQARNYPERNIITRCIGMSSPDPEIYVNQSCLNPGEIFLLCSDGVWEFLTEEEIITVLSSELSLPEKTDTLINKALSNGSTDNLSICICTNEKQSVSKKEERPFILD